MKREAVKLFPPGYFDDLAPTPAEEARQKVDSLRRTAQNLRDLAARGMSRRKFAREAALLEAEADAIVREMP